MKQKKNSKLSPKWEKDGRRFEKKAAKVSFSLFFWGKEEERDRKLSPSHFPLSLSLPLILFPKICSAKTSQRPQATTQHSGASLWQKKIEQKKKAKISAAQLSLSPTTEFEKCIFYFLSSKKGRQKASPDGMTVDDVCHVCPIPFLVGLGWEIAVRQDENKVSRKAAIPFPFVFWKK